jgi:hypothetical protein
MWEILLNVGMRILLVEADGIGLILDWIIKFVRGE